MLWLNGLNLKPAAVHKLKRRRPCSNLKRRRPCSKQTPAMKQTLEMKLMLWHSTQVLISHASTLFFFK
jgi:hypothetical protein